MRVEQAIARYKMFLLLVYLYPNTTIVPTREIDEVWHKHLSDTRKYREDCELLFGRFIDHFPYFGLRGELDRQDLETSFVRTKALFEQHFGADSLGAAAAPPHVYVEPPGDWSIDFPNQMDESAACIPLYPSMEERPRADIDLEEAWQMVEDALEETSALNQAKDRPSLKFEELPASEQEGIQQGLAAFERGEFVTFEDYQQRRIASQV